MTRGLRGLRDPDRFRPWLLAIAYRQVQLHLRGRQRRHPQPVGVPDPAATSAAPTWPRRWAVLSYLPSMLHRRVVAAATLATAVAGGGLVFAVHHTPPGLWRIRPSSPHRPRVALCGQQQRRRWSAPPPSSWRRTAPTAATAVSSAPTRR